MASTRQIKSDMRRRDAADIASGRRTREEVQKENGIFPRELCQTAVLHIDHAEFAAAAEEFVKWRDANPHR